MNLLQTDSLTEEQIQSLWRMYQNEWWSKRRTLRETEIMVKNTDILIAFLHQESNELAGFCRVLTDYIFKAVIMDVIVHPNYRGRGIGMQLMDAAVHHQKLVDVETIDLWCLDEMVPYYHKWQFTDQLGRIRFMRRSHRNLDELILE